LICYLDSSALVKRYIVEPGSEEVEQLVSAAEVVGTAWISLVEVVAALARAARTGVLTSEEAESAIDSFKSDWLHLARLQITEFLVSESANLARKYGLRGYDAVQLAAATLWQRNLELPVYMVTFDRQLWLAAASEGLIARPEALVRSD
jgi:predicted nucleic acid-binding protein